MPHHEDDDLLRNTQEATAERAKKETVRCLPAEPSAEANGRIRRRQIGEDVVDSANQRQVGGAHYGLGARQHWDLVVEFEWDYFQGQITKYVMRHKKKHGVQDLEKAQHFLEKYIEEIKAGRIK